MNPPSVSPQTAAGTDASTGIRALVLSADRRYRNRAVTVIGDVAEVVFAIVAPTAADDVWWLVRREQANVVVLDATGCEAAVADVIARLATVAPRLGLVVVCEHLTQPARELRALPKWGWTSELRAAVERAHVDGNPLARPRTPWQAGRRDLRGVARAPLSRR